MNAAIVPTEDRIAKLAAAETAAQIVVNNYKVLGNILVEVEKARKRFTEVAKEFAAEFQMVKSYFVHKPMQELFLGKYRTGDEWSKGELGITYNWFCQCMKKTPKFPTVAPLLLPEPAPEPDPSNVSTHALHEEQSEPAEQVPTVSDFTAVLTEMFTKLSALNALTKEVGKGVDAPTLEQVRALVASLRKISKDTAERADRLEVAVTQVAA